MALIKCPECGKEISDRAARCPHCGITMEDIQHELRHLNTDEFSNNEGAYNYEPQQEECQGDLLTMDKTVDVTSRKGKKWLWYVIIAAALLIIASVVFVPKLFSNICGADGNSTHGPFLSKTTKLPTIAENGVAPFVLGASIIDIPYHGDFYDTIIYKTLYLVSGIFDGEIYEWDEQQMEDYKKSHEEYNESGWAYNEIVDTHINCYVVSKSDTLMVVICDSALKINCVEIYSDKLQLDNGIHVGLSSVDMYSKFNAKYVCEEDTRCLGNYAPPAMGYVVPEMSNTIGLVAAKRNNITFEGTDYPIFPVHGIKSSDGLWILPLEDVKDDYVARIIIAKNAYPCLFEKNKSSFFNMILQ